MRLSMLLACALLATAACKKKEPAGPADAGVRLVVPLQAPASAPRLPAPAAAAPGVPPPVMKQPAAEVPKSALTTPPQKNAVPPPPAHKGAPQPGEAIQDPEDVE